MPVPTYDGLFNPLLRAMHELGGSASVGEQEDKVAQLLNLSEEEASEIHRGNRSKLSYRLAWARNYLKRAGLLENSARGVWALTANGKSVQKDYGPNRSIQLAAETSASGTSLRLKFFSPLGT